jgi:chromosomal replication initiator protein
MAPQGRTVIASGSLTQLAHYAYELEQHSDLLDFLHRYLTEERPTLHEINSAVCDFYGLTPQNLAERTRRCYIVGPRQIACYLARTLTLRSLNEIARRVGLHDHSSVWHAVRHVRTLITSDEIIRDDVDVLKADIAARVFARHKSKDTA